jgi:hypothetical protein
MDYDSDKSAAKKRLMQAVADLDLTEAEEKTVQWLMGWDLGAIERAASIIEKARAAGYRIGTGTLA